MIVRPSRARLLEVWRYYQAGVVNTGFGFGLYSLLIWLGINMFAAQLLSHCIGVAFNYISYRRHVFRDASSAKMRFTLSYAFNYLAGLAVLASVAQFIVSPYLAGFVSVVIVSFINYFVLKQFVFKAAKA
ncbi:GtrA family protein [Novosphingobium sp. G106]|uniref:GtrA family protein n=1 Tax=Novosphingobium sp. G106 TaxID=2849500 RepID=UPI001C2D715E|nr:GtrA family protein [Novosphingobium sp. G106]MBV1690032.1 GtrA family protein [Novosphingobium sp. G106]